jgi:hypothetical protein
MTNAEWMIKNGYKFSDLHFSVDSNGNIVISLNDKILVRGLHIPFEDALKRWLDKEHDEKILNDAEKKYLSAVIKPFRDRVEFICKLNSLERYGFQCIDIRFTDESIDMELPIFKSGTMYKGMEFGKEYTLEELGL